MAHFAIHTVSALLLLTGPLLAQARVQAAGALPGPGLSPAQEGRAEPDEDMPEDVTLPAFITGQVLHSDGRPAAGAVVVSSAGGLAEVGEDGLYELKLRVAPEVSAVQVTAVASGPQGSLTAQAQVGGIVPFGRNASPPLHLSAAAGCTPDWIATFGGQAGMGGYVAAFATFDDGNGAALYVGGGFQSAGGEDIPWIAKWDGSAWSSLDTVNGAVRALAVFDDGTGPALYAAGTFTQAGGQQVNRIAKWDGSAWSPLGGGLGGSFLPSVRALAVFDDGSGPALYAAGNFTTAGGPSANRIAKWDGSAWSPLGPGMNDLVHTLAVFDDGSGDALYAGGSFFSTPGQPASRISKWDGSAWSGLGAGVNNTVRALTVFDDGSGAALYAGGEFQHAAGQLVRGIAKWNGSAWSPLGSGMNDWVSSLSVFDDGSGAALYAGGRFTRADDLPANRIAKWDGSAWSPLGVGVTSGFAWPEVYALTTFDSGSGTELYVGGAFTSAGTVGARFLAKWGAGRWSTMLPDAGLNDAVEVLAVLDDGTGPMLYAGGHFTIAGDEVVNRIAKWDGVAWSRLGGGVSGVIPGGPPAVHALAQYDDGSGSAIYAGGTFTVADGTQVNHVAKWDGSAWSALGTGIQGGATPSVNALVVFDDGSGPALYAGGLFSGAGDLAAVNLARWNGSTWSPVGGGVHGGISFPTSVYTLAVYDDGTGPALYAGGYFRFAGGLPVYSIAKWKGNVWSAVGPDLFERVFSFAVFDDGSGEKLYFGARTSGSANRIASWDGSVFAVEEQVNGHVLALAVLDDGAGEHLYAGGAFTNIAGQAARYTAKRNGPGSWAPLGSGVSGSPEVRALESYDDGSGPALFVGGKFVSSPAGDTNLAKWGCEIPIGAPYCFGDGSGTPCPCGNTGPDDGGCANSTGQGARLSAFGSSSVAAGDLVLSGSRLPAGLFGLYFQGDQRLNGGSGDLFGDGLHCAGGAILRLEVAPSNAAGESSTTVGIAALGALLPGDLRTYQLWYRDMAISPCGTGFNLTNGLELAWEP